MTDQSDFADHVLSLGINNIGDSYALAFTATYICGGKTFQILVAGDPPPGYDTQSTEVEWTEQLLDLSMHDGTDVAQFMAQDIFLQKLAQDIMRIALPKMLELAPPAHGLPPPRDPRRGVHTVYEHLCPDMVKLQLVSRDGCFELIEGHNTQLPADDLKPITHSELEKFGVKDTELLPTHAASEVVLLSQCKAGMSAYYATNLKRTEEWVCKLAYRWCQEATLRELETLAKIQTSRLRPGLELRVSTLKALVTYKDKVVGLLIDKIPTQYSSLEDVVRGSLKVPLSLRRKWAAQIEDTVKELHCLGIIWGDAKPGNIVIDECDDAWLIDFGGGFTQPWVDSELAESVEGDLQAVGRIRERLEED